MVDVRFSGRLPAGAARRWFAHHALEVDPRRNTRGSCILKGGKLPRPCGVAFTDVTMNFAVVRIVPALPLNGDWYLPHRAVSRGTRGQDAAAKFSNRDGPLLFGL